MKPLRSIVAAALVLLLHHAPAQAQMRSSEPVRITYLMSAPELDRAGLGRLTAEQIDALSAWLANYRAAAEHLALSEAQGEGGVAASEPEIESRIDGDFDGWVGDTVFRLQNGQIWQQTSPSAKYLFANAPRVHISRSPYRLRVEGLAVEISVRRLK
jgi:hypothetical protein